MVYCWTYRLSSASHRKPLTVPPSLKSRAIFRFGRDSGMSSTYSECLQLKRHMTAQMLFMRWCRCCSRCFSSARTAPPGAG